MAREYEVPFRKIFSTKHVGVWLWTHILTGNVHWYDRSTRKHQCHNPTEIYFSLMSYTLAQVSRASRRERELLRGSQGTRLKSIWENIKIWDVLLFLWLRSSIRREGNSLFPLCSPHWQSLYSETKGGSICLRCLLLPAWGSDYKAEDKPWRQAHLGLPLATSLALGKLLNPCKILATLCSLEIITAPTSQGCFEDKMRYCIKRESLQRLAHSIYLSTHSV